MIPKECPKCGAGPYFVSDAYTEHQCGTRSYQGKVSQDDFCRERCKVKRLKAENEKLKQKIKEMEAKK